MLPDWLSHSQHALLAKRINRFLDGFTTPADMAKETTTALPVPITQVEFVNLRRRWLVLIRQACGSDRIARRRASERVRDFFKRHFQPIP